MKSITHWAVPLAVVASFAPTAFAQQSAARIWDEQLLAAIRIDFPRPPVHARNLYHFSVCAYDAWAVYSPSAVQVVHQEKINPAAVADVEAARHEAISYAAYRMIRHRYAVSPNAATTLAALDAQMAALGYPTTNTTLTGNSPAAVGNRVFESVKAAGLLDNANEAGNYAPNNGYLPVNHPMPVFYNDFTLTFPLPYDGSDDAHRAPDPNRWQPLFLENYILQNGLPAGTSIQAAVCPHWGGVSTFALNGPHPNNVYLDPGAPPRLGTATDAQFKATFLDVIRLASHLDPSDGVTLDIGPATHHNNTLGNNDGTGYGTNPVTGQPYAPNIAKRGDYTRILADFWADGPHSETPPGHWNVIANTIADHPLLQKRIAGNGPVCNNLEWDVKVYLAMNGALHDAAIACWGAKGYYDSSRPFTAIRHMCSKGQSTNVLGPRYNVQGIPLEPDLVELTTFASVQPGGRHALIGDYYENNFGDPNARALGVNKVAVRGWRGKGTNGYIEPVPSTGQGVGWIEGARWLPFQAPTFVTPPFPGFYSGHSTYSRSAAEVLTAITGSSYFPGGLMEVNIPLGWLHMEPGPSQAIRLQWARYFDAADEAGISRIYGGIHPPVDDRAGRINGSAIGQTAWTKALTYFAACKADLGRQGGLVGADGMLDNNDFVVFINLFFANDPAADMGAQGGVESADGLYDNNDFVVFINRFFTGC